jgi:type VI secretion system secreted protein Hcp
MAIYMEYEGIKGNVTAAGYQGMIQLDFFVLRTSREISMKVGLLANREIGLPKLGVIETGKKLDGAFTGVIKEVFSGSAGKKVKIHFVRNGQGQLQEFMTLSFNNCLPTFYRMVATSREGGIPAERLYLSYSAVEVTYSGSGADNKAQGPMRNGYDLVTATSL